MKAQFFLFPAALVLASPVQAKVFMSVEQAQQLMFPGSSFTQNFHVLSDQEAAAIERKSGVDAKGRQLKAWKVSNDGWFIADEVAGDHDFIPFALALDEHGSVKSVEILEYREYVGEEVRDPKWLAQFVGKKDGSSLKLDKDIQNISGATLSSQHLTEGIRRLLASYEVVLASR